MPPPYRTKVLYTSPGGMPNGLQSTPEGLWVCDQVDPNVMYLLDPVTGDSLKEIPTRCLHGSGISSYFGQPSIDRLAGWLMNKRYSKRLPHRG